MQVVLLVVQVIIAVALIGCVLIQRTAQDGGGLMGGGGGGTMGGLFTARGSANLLTRTTAILATCFLLNCLVLAYIAGHGHRGKGSPLDQLRGAATSETTDQKRTGSQNSRDEQGEGQPKASTSKPSGTNTGAAKPSSPEGSGGKTDQSGQSKPPAPPQVPITK